MTDRSRSDLDALKAILAQEIKTQGFRRSEKNTYLIVISELMAVVLLCHQFQDSRRKAALCCGSIMTDMRNCVILFWALGQVFTAALN